MGMYTKFRFKAELIPETPWQVQNILRCLIYGIPLPENEWEIYRGHRFFQCQRASCLCNGADGKFPPNTRRSEIYRLHEKEGYVYFVDIISAFKNYDNEKFHFLGWIWPFIAKEPDKYMGWYRYDEDDVATNIYQDKESFRFVRRDDEEYFKNKHFSNHERS